MWAQRAIRSMYLGLGVDLFRFDRPSPDDIAAYRLQRQTVKGGQPQALSDKEIVAEMADKQRRRSARRAGRGPLVHASGRLDQKWGKEANTGASTEAGAIRRRGRRRHNKANRATAQKGPVLPPLPPCLAWTRKGVTVLANQARTRQRASEAEVKKLRLTLRDPPLTAEKTPKVKVQQPYIPPQPLLPNAPSLTVAVVGASPKAGTTSVLVRATEQAQLFLLLDTA